MIIMKLRPQKAAAPDITCKDRAAQVTKAVKEIGSNEVVQPWRRTSKRPYGAVSLWEETLFQELE